MECNFTTNSLSFDRWMESRNLSQLCDANIVRAILLTVTHEVTSTQIHELISLKSLITGGVKRMQHSNRHLGIQVC